MSISMSTSKSSTYPKRRVRDQREQIIRLLVYIQPRRWTKIGGRSQGSPEALVLHSGITVSMTAVVEPDYTR